MHFYSKDHLRVGWRCMKSSKVIIVRTAVTLTKIPYFILGHTFETFCTLTWIATSRPWMVRWKLGGGGMNMLDRRVTELCLAPENRTTIYMSCKTAFQTFFFRFSPQSAQSNQSNRSHPTWCDRCQRLLHFQGCGTWPRNHSSFS